MSQSPYRNRLEREPTTEGILVFGDKPDANSTANHVDAVLSTTTPCFRCQARLASCIWWSGSQPCCCALRSFIAVVMALLAKIQRGRFTWLSCASEASAYESGSVCPALHKKTPRPVVRNSPTFCVLDERANALVGHSRSSNCGRPE